MEKRNNIIIFLILLTVVSVFGQDLYAKYLEEAKSFYLIKDYGKAMSRIQFVLKNHENFSLVPADEKSLSEKIYYSYLKELFDRGSHTEIKSFASSNPYYSDIAKISPRVADIVSGSSKIVEEAEKEELVRKAAENERLRIEKLEAAKREAEEKYRAEMERLEAERKAEQERLLEERRKELERIAEERKKETERLLAERKAETEKLLAADSERRRQEAAARQTEQQNLMKFQEQIIREKAVSETSAKEQMDAVINTFVTMREKEAQGNYRIIITVTVVIAAIFALLLLSMIVLFILSYRSSRKQQEIYMNYAEKIAVPQRDYLPAPVINDVADAVYMIEDKSQPVVDSSARTGKALPSPAGGEEHEKEKLRIIVEQCKAFGEAIDNATQRKNCSRNAAELVYKISVLLGKPTWEAMVHYSVGLVYDIGFLSIDSSLLSQPSLSEEQHEMIKKHTTSGLHMIHFVDSQYRQIFIEGITKHHENMDGSGYPEGLKGKDIPYIARVIRVVDSYVSMISNRVYRGIYDKETAFSKLKEEKGVYDEKIMEALSSII